MAEVTDLAAANELTAAQFELLALYADGELARDSAQLAAAEALLAAESEARGVLANLHSAKASLRDYVVGEASAAAVTADLSLIRGRVLTKLPAEPRPVVATTGQTGVVAWLRSFGFGKVSLAFGAAVAVAAWLVVSPQAPAPLVAGPAVAAESLGEESSVIIEEIDVESGTISVTPGVEASQPTVIWHFEGERQGEG